MATMHERIAHVLRGRVRNSASPENLAQGALMAMKEPTESMLRAVWSRDNSNDERERKRLAADWRIMVEAAIKEVSDENS